MAQLAVYTLGCFTVTLDGQPLRGFESDKVRALLAYLAVESDRAHSREKLAALLWPEAADDHAHACFNQALYNLRSVLGERQAPQPFLTISRQAVQLNPQCDCRVDVNTFGELLEQCVRHAHPRRETCAECAARLEQAAALYRGDFLEGFNLANSIPYDEWAMVAREQLHQQLLSALAELTAYYEGQGEVSRALGYARRFVELDPLWEAGLRSLLRMLALDGRARRPCGSTRASARRSRKSSLSSRSARHRPFTSACTWSTQETASTDNLPAHLTPFIGRQGELAELSALLRDAADHLVTVLGAGGCGKTRLALQAARRLSYHFPDGVFYVPLSALASIQALLPSVALALGFKFQEGSEPPTAIAGVPARQTHPAAAGQLRDCDRGSRLAQRPSAQRTAGQSAGHLAGQAQRQRRAHLSLERDGLPLQRKKSLQPTSTRPSTAPCSYS